MSRNLTEAKEENIKEIIRMLENKIDLDIPIKNGVTRLMASVYLDDIKAVKLLLRNKANINARDSLGQTALMISIFTRNIPMTRYLIKKKVNVDNLDNEGKSALMFAASMGEIEIVNELLMKRANIRYRSYDLDYDAFTFAALNNHVNILSPLLGYNPKDKDGNTDLILLIDQEDDQNPSLSTIKFILDRKFFNVNERNNNGETALMIASFKGKDYIVELLINKGAHLEIEDLGGRTALYYAILGRNLNTAKLLVNMGANVHTSVKLGETLIDIVEDEEIKEFLQENM